MNGLNDVPQLGTAAARISECGSHGYQVEFNYGDGGHEAFVFPSLAAARAAVEQAVAEAEGEIKRADCEVRQRILAHSWWQTPIPAEEMSRILELASLRTDGVVLVDPWGGYAWAPRGTWHTGRHLRLEVPSGGHCTTSAAFAFWKQLDDALKPDNQRQIMTSELER